MPITRKFIDWDRPILPAATDYLVAKHSSQGVLNLERVVVVLPGGRAGRRLLELLALRAQRDELVFLPPQITTAGALPELLYESKRPFASTGTPNAINASIASSNDANGIVEATRSVANCISQLRLVVLQA